MTSPHLPHLLLKAAPPLLTASDAPVEATPAVCAEEPLPATVRAAARWGVAVRVLPGGTAPPRAP